MGCAEVPVKWDKTDKKLMGTFTILEATDCFQTRKIKDDPAYREKYNPLIKKLDKGETTLYFIGSWAATWWIANKLKPKWRKLFLIGGTSIQLYMVGNNISVGLGIPIE